MAAKTISEFAGLTTEAIVENSGSYRLAEGQHHTDIMKHDGSTVIYKAFPATGELHYFTGERWWSEKIGKRNMTKILNAIR